MKNIILLAMLSLLFSCAKESNKRPSSNNLLQGVKKQTSQKEDLTSQGYNLSLKKSALENQLFLMGVSYIGGAPAPTGYSLANKVVYFKRKGNSVYLFESLQGKLDTDDVRTELLLAKFPITHDQEQTIVFDFDHGMKYLFEKSSYYIASPTVKDEDMETVMDIKESFLNKVEQRGDSLYVEQYARLYSHPTPKSKGENFSLHLKYNFQNYVKNENFKPVESIGFNNVGYFENHPVHEAGTGIKKTYIAHFDHNKTILFYLSNDIPKEHLQAVKDGVLYWNKAFGKEVLKVAMLPKGLDVHEPGINLVKWLNWDTAGFAYANTGMDPLTGEALQATVYMTSSFGNGGLRRAKYYLQRLKDETKVESPKVNLRGFAAHKFCERSHEDESKRIGSLIETVTSIEELELSEAEKEVIYSRFANDYIRETVAHEVGHNLGLRHNFAASTQTTIKAKEFDKVTAHYLLTGEVLENKVVATSVMDYTPSFFAAMGGAHIRSSSKALLYDQKAIDFGYLGKELHELPATPFCTDHEASGSSFVDCLRFDRFSNPIEESHYDFTRSLQTLSYKLAGQLALKEENGNVHFMRELFFDAAADATTVINNSVKPLLGRLSTKARFIQLDRTLNFAGTISAMNYLAETRAFQKSSAKKYAGINFVIDTMNPKEGSLDLSKFIKERVFFILENKYGEISEDNKMKVNKALDFYLPYLEKEYLLQATQYFTMTKFNIVEESFVENLINAGEKLILDTTDIPFERKYDYKVRGKDLRLVVAKMLKNNYYKSNPYIDSIKKESLTTIAAKLKSEIKSLETNEEEMTEDLYNFIQSEKKILSKIK